VALLQRIKQSFEAQASQANNGQNKEMAEYL
jgi:hypothetical protein